jgi:hypothetical protein
VENENRGQTPPAGILTQRVVLPEKALVFYRLSVIPYTPEQLRRKNYIMFFPFGNGGGKGSGNGFSAALAAIGLVEQAGFALDGQVKCTILHPAGLHLGDDEASLQ